MAKRFLGAIVTQLLTIIVDILLILFTVNFTIYIIAKFNIEFLKSLTYSNIVGILILTYTIKRLFKPNTYTSKKVKELIDTIPLSEVLFDSLSGQAVIFVAIAFIWLATNIIF